MLGKSAYSVVLLLLVVCVLPAGCRSRWWRRERPVEPTVETLDAPLSLAQAAAILRGQAPGILVAANRGLTGQNAPPNSLEAIRSAIDYGVPMVVVDVGKTADGRLVLDTTARPSGDKPSDGNVGPSTSRTSRPAASSRPALADALELARGKLIVGLRLRSVPPDAAIGTIQEAGMTDQVVVFLTDTDQARAVAPHLRRGRSLAIGFEAPTSARLSQIESTPPWPAFLTLGPKTLSPANISRVRAMGARAMVHQRGVLLVRIGTDVMPYHRIGVTVLLTDWPRQLLREMRKINRQVREIKS